MAATTAIGFVLLGTALVATAGPDSFPIRCVTGDATSARLSRVFLPLTVAAVLIAGAAPLHTSRSAVLNQPLALAALALVVAAIAAGMIARLAHSMGGSLEESSRRLSEALAEAQRFREALDRVPCYVYMKDLESRYVYANRLTRELFGRSAEELAGCDDTHFFPPATVMRLREVDSCVFEGEQTSEEIEVADERDGRRIYWEVKTPIYSGSGHETVVGLLGISTDITERSLAEEMLRSSSRRLNEAQRLAGLGDWEFDLTTGVVTWSDKLFALQRCDPARGAPGMEELAGYYTSESWQRLAIAVDQAIAAGAPYRLDLLVIREDGTRWWQTALGEAVRSTGGKVVRLRGTVQDITERQRAEEEVLESRDRLRDLTARLDEVREEERTALARELHDQVGQNLTAMRMDLAMVEQEIPAGMERLTDSLHSMIALAQDSVDRVNRMSSELRSAILDILGLEAAVESEVLEYQTRWKTDIGLEVDLGEFEARPERDLTVFRILKESLSNVRRHARANRVEVSLRMAEQDLVLEVLDDGIGITDDQLRSRRSFGLMGMRERVDRVGGNLEVQRRDEGGTRVLAKVPIMLNSG